MYGYGYSLYNRLAFLGGLDPNASDFLTATGITDPTITNAINSLVVGMKSDGTWTKMKAIYPFATDNRNLSSFSEDYSNLSNWGKALVNTTANTIISPNGTLTASTLTTTANNNNAIYNTNRVATSTNQTFTHSIYLKYNNAQWVTLEIWNGGGQIGIRLWVDIQNGILGTANATLGTYTSSSITNMGNGWYRVSVTGVMPNASAVYLALRHVDGNGEYNFTAVNGKATYIWGAQSEVGTLTDYQPIATSQQTYISSQFKFNLKDPRDLDAAFRLAFNGGWTHSSNGALPNGTNGYANTFLTQINAGMFNNTHISYYSRTNNVSASLRVEMGIGYPGTNTYGNLLFRLDNSSNVSGGTMGSRNAFSTSTDSTGYMIVNSTSLATKSYKNNMIIATNSSTQTGVAGAYNIYIGSQGSGTTAQQFTDRQCAFATIGDGLTDTEASNLYTRVQAFQTTLSRNI